MSLGLFLRKGRKLKWLKLWLFRRHLDKSSIDSALKKLKYRPADVVLVHSSLSSCGFVVGAANTMIASINEWCSSSTIAMPTHTYCYPDADGCCEVFDLVKTSSRVGAVSELFRKLSGSRRSLHPTHSLACSGGLANTITSGHENCETPCGKGTPYEKMLNLNTGVLMIGVSMDSYTLFHTAEDACQVPYLYYPDFVDLKIRVADGSVMPFRMRRQDMRVNRRFDQVASWLQERKLLFRIALGHGELLWIPSASDVHEAICKEIRNTPRFLVV